MFAQQQTVQPVVLAQPAQIVQQPMLNAPLFAAPSSLPAKAAKQPKARRGHHHGTRDKRAQAVLPAQQAFGGPAIATLASPAPFVAAPIAQPALLAQPAQIVQQPLLNAPLFAGSSSLPAQAAKQPKQRKARRGHHHGTRDRRAEAVLPVQQGFGGPAIATLASLTPAPIVAAPAMTRAMPMQQAGQEIYREPIIQEVYRTDVITQIQPVIHRQIEQPVIHIIEKHYTEAAPAQGRTVQLAPIIEETRTTRVINEIQPVVHREAVNIVTERVEEHLAERVVAPTQHQSEVLYEAAPVIAPVAAINSAPLTNTVPITNVVPSAAAPVAYPTLMPTEKKPTMMNNLKSKLHRNKNGQAAM